MEKEKSIIERIKDRCKGYGIDQMLEEIIIQEVDEELAALNNINGLIGWFAVVDTDGINSYHSTESEALKQRLNIINQVLNG